MPLKRPLKAALSFPRWIKRGLVIFLDTLVCFVSTWLAFCLRLDEIAPLSSSVFAAAGIGVSLFIPIFVTFGLHRAIVRFTGSFVTTDLVKAILIYFVFYGIAILIIRVEGIPRSIGVIQPLLFFVGAGAVRWAVKYLLVSYVNKSGNNSQVRTALIYGAGSAGRQIASGLRHASEIKLVGFIDDDSRLWGGQINGLPVYASEKISQLVGSKKEITDILLAIPSANRARRREVLSALSDLPVHVCTLPGLSALASGTVKVEDFREVEIDDLLGRDPVQANEMLLQKNIVGKVVMVTGAGGSIGSELCRQILAQNPKKLVLFELSEFALYSIEKELTNRLSSVPVIPILGSVLDANKLSLVIRRFGVHTIYHAAAYKHVPMIELNPASGVWNNVFGTFRLVTAACKEKVETLVLISTDKAVRPTNIMGCSKRIAELVLQAKSLKDSLSGDPVTKLTMVRFGNVLGSSGSVVPVFREQIKNGGPVTVTHPEIIRYFMTIPEAAQLVIQAGAMGEGGDVMVLDMGAPVKIVDLAKRMIHLSGFSCKDDTNPDGDIEILFTGLRPGEKLYEELLIGSNVLPTLHSRIMRASEDSLPWEVLENLLIKLEDAIRTEDNNAILGLIKAAVPEFNSPY